MSSSVPDFESPNPTGKEEATPKVSFLRTWSMRRLRSARAWRRLVLWNWKQQWPYMMCQGAAGAALLWWIPYRHLPWTGTGVAIIAFLAALMSVHRDLQRRHKVLYFTLMAFLLITEFRAMRKDRSDNQQDQRTAQSELAAQENTRLEGLLAGERENTRKLLEQENTNLGSVLRQDQGEFERSLTAILKSHKEDEDAFGNVVKKQEDMLQEQHDLSEQLFGRLVPGSSPTPVNACSGNRDLPSDGVTVIYGGSASITRTFPHTILEVGNAQVISIDRVPGSPDLALSLNFTDTDNRIILRIDKNGAVLRTSGLILLHPDKSTFLIQDEYGKDFLRASYLNQSTLEVQGTGFYCGRTFRIGNGNSICIFGGADMPDISGGSGCISPLHE